MIADSVTCSEEQYWTRHGNGESRPGNWGEGFPHRGNEWQVQMPQGQEWRLPGGATEKEAGGKGGSDQVAAGPSRPQFGFCPLSEGQPQEAQRARDCQTVPRRDQKSAGGSRLSFCPTISSVTWSRDRYQNHQHPRQEDRVAACCTRKAKRK